jgi:hypothetical protein
MCLNCALETQVTLETIGKIIVQGLSVKLLTDSLFWLNMDIWGKGTAVFAHHV